jgi:glycosyltransferase involved in cell wall biosynthesis
MRILFSHYLASDDHPATRMVHAAAAEIAQLGHRVLVHRTQDLAAAPRTTSDLSSDSSPPTRGCLRRSLWFLRELERNRRGYQRDRQALLRFRPDVVICRQDAYRFSMPLACARLGIPLVTFADAPVAYETRHFNGERRWHPPGLVERIERWGLQRSREVVAISQPTAKLIRQLGFDGPVTVVPNGVDVQRFGPRSEPLRLALRDRYGITTPLVAGFLGTFRAFHGLPLLRDVIRQSLNRSDVTWILIGDGPERATLETLAGHPRVRLLGARPATEIPDLLATFDVMVVPHQRLVSEFYFCPIKVLEGMASGLACLASQQGDIPTLLDHGRAGVLVPDDRLDNWVDALHGLLDDPRRMRMLGRAARARVEANYTWPQVGYRLESVLQSAGSRPAGLARRFTPVPQVG